MIKKSIRIKLTSFREASDDSFFNQILGDEPFDMDDEDMDMPDEYGNGIESFDDIDDMGGDF